MKKPWENRYRTESSKSRIEQYSEWLTNAISLEPRYELVDYHPKGSTETVLAREGIFTLYEDEVNGHRYYNPRMNDELAEAFFQEFMPDYFCEVEGSQEERVVYSYNVILDQVSRYNESSSSILEVGCGSTAFLRFLSKNGYTDLYGIDPAIREEEASTDGLPYRICRASISSFKTEKRFDTVLMWSVADHFTFPDQAFSRVYELLNPGGRLIIGNVNIEGFDLSCLSMRSTIYDPPNRVNFYSISSMVNELENAGLSIENIATPGKLDMRIVIDYCEKYPDAKVPEIAKILVQLRNQLDKYTLNRLVDSVQSVISSCNASGYQAIVAKKVPSGAI